MAHYAPIADYALIGNGHTAALIDREGSIDWCCMPRFDSGAVFSRLLDWRRGGFFQIVPAEPFTVSRHYIDSTNILETTFEGRSGVLRLTDFMPAPGRGSAAGSSPHQVLRKVECVRGSIDIRLECQPRFDFGREEAEFFQHPEGVTARTASQQVELRSPFDIRARRGKLYAEQTIGEGEQSWVTLAHAQRAQHAPRLAPTELAKALEDTKRYWRQWVEQCRYDGPYRDLVIRSALVLKLLIYEPSGGVIAAPSCSLPDEIGGQRNWDYRYTWLRDSGMLLDSLQQLGFHEESENFIDWLQQVCHPGKDDLRIMYRVDGTNAPDERPLTHFDGYLGSRPVLVGNGATDQSQIDVYGHVVDATVLCFERMPRPLPPGLWQLLSELVNRASSGWEQPDHGPWEIRGEAKHYLYSKLYCWVGIDRAIRFAEAWQLEGDVEWWKQQRRRLRETIETKGFDTDQQAFTQAFGSSHLDATGLTMTFTGFLPANDPRMESTIRQIDRHLSENGLLYRYRHDDGLPGSDNTFTLCGFWMVMNLALMGATEEAVSRFETICGYANDVGLMSEQIDADRGLSLGNFPQGFSHLGLIRAALHLRDAQHRKDHP